MPGKQHAEVEPHRAAGWPKLGGRGAQYGFALVAILLATLLRLPFEPWLQGRAPYGLYFPVLVAVAWLAGMGATIFAIALSLAIAWALFVPDEPGYLPSLGVYLVVAASLVALSRAAAAMRKRAEESLAITTRLAAIVESSEDAIVAKNFEGRIESWNAAAERLFGYTADEIIGRPITVLLPPERVAEEDMILERLRRGERVDHFETVRLGKGGRRLELSLTISPIRDTTGAVVGASKIARDIGERKRAERGLAEQREWLRVTLTSIGDAVITTDHTGAVTFLNPVAERLTGHSLDDARGRPLARVFQIINEDTRLAVENPCDEVLRKGAIVGLANHTALLARDGREIPIEDSAAPIVNDAHEVVGVVLVFHDVTERRRGEHDLLRAVGEREQLLQSERAARGEAERANRLKDDFVATLSHELRSPLNAILGWTEILQRNPHDPATFQRGLGVIERNARLQAHLISDLLDVSRIVAGKLRLDLQLVSLAGVVGEAVETVKTSADSKRVAIECTIDPGIDPIAGDPARLQQIVWNLLSNAIKFSSEGGRVGIRVERHEPWARITVTDEGAGVRPEFLPHLFDRFRQADTSTTRRQGGLGLGLMIVKQLVELHGGTVRAHSEGEGRGARFVVELPLDSAGGHVYRGPERRRRTAAVSYESRMHLLAGLDVLVVDDEPDARELVERLLSEAGCSVTAVESAEQALRVLATDRPQLLISDIGLPHEDGYSLIKRIRRLDRAQGGAMPAIALTAFARTEDRARALLAGFQAHIGKPVDAGELLATVTSLADMLAADRRSADDATRTS